MGLQKLLNKKTITIVIAIVVVIFAIFYSMATTLLSLQLRWLRLY